MRVRPLVRFLVVAAVLVWSWALISLVAPFLVDRDKLQTQPGGTPPVRWTWAHPDSLVRDPFRTRQSVPVVRTTPVRSTTVAGKSTADSLVVPNLGALLGGTPPMAILESAGSTLVVKSGDLAFGWKVLSVQQGRVVLLEGKRRVVLE
jgi:hypothetical protein